MEAKHFALRAGLAALGSSGLARAVRPITQGLGAILMLHHVRPYAAKVSDPHRGLEVSPVFLDRLLTHARRLGFDIIPISAVAARLNALASKPFVVLTFDDGYRDNIENALPILRRHDAPFTLYVTTGFAEGTAPLWWRDLAECVPPGEYARVLAELEGSPELRPRIAALAAAKGIDSLARTRTSCLRWDELRDLASEPLCTIGAHTLTHPILATLDEDDAREEIARSKANIERQLGREVRHLAYPVGGPAAAGPREFALARAAGFETAVTTRPGMLFPAHAAHLHALPRLSINGRHQSIDAFDTLLTGAPFWLLNHGRKLNIR